MTGWKLITVPTELYNDLNKLKGKRKMKSIHAVIRAMMVVFE